MRPLLPTNRIGLGFWLKLSFVVNYQGAFQSIVIIAINLSTSEDQYFLWITAVPLPSRCLQFQQHLGPHVQGVTLTLSGPPNLRPKSNHSSLLDALTVPSTHCIPKIVFTLSPIYRACTNSSAIYLIIMKDLIFFSASATSNPPFHLVGCDSWWLRNNLSIPRAPENMCYKNIITIYYHIWM